MHFTEKRQMIELLTAIKYRVIFDCQDKVCVTGSLSPGLSPALFLCYNSLGSGIYNKSFTSNSKETLLVKLYNTVLDELPRIQVRAELGVSPVAEVTQHMQLAHEPTECSSPPLL